MKQVASPVLPKDLLPFLRAQRAWTKGCFGFRGLGKICFPVGWSSIWGLGVTEYVHISSDIHNSMTKRSVTSFPVKYTQTEVAFSVSSFRVSVKIFPTWLTPSIRYNTLRLLDIYLISCLYYLSTRLLIIFLSFESRPASAQLVSILCLIQVHQS